MRLTIKAEASPGTIINDAFKEATELAGKLNCFVEFEFNSVTCIARPNGDADKGTAEYHEAIQKDSPYKFATS